MNDECRIEQSDAGLRPHSAFCIPHSALKNKTLIVIAGPTASGKTAFSINMAKALSTVILSSVDEGVFRKLGTHLTSEPVYETKKLYH